MEKVWLKSKGSGHIQGMRKGSNHNRGGIVLSFESGWRGKGCGKKKKKVWSGVEGGSEYI